MYACVCVHTCNEKGEIQKKEEEEEEEGMERNKAVTANAKQKNTVESR